MNRTTLILGSLLAGCLFLFTGCSQTPTELPVIPTNAAAPATEVVATLAPTPTATATELPLLPCNIAFDSDRDNNHEIYVMAPDGSNPTNLTNDPADDFDPVWSPDGTHIAFVSNRPNETGEGQFLYVMRSDGSEVKQVSHQDQSTWPDWSPLGNQIVYSGKGDLYLIDLTSGNEVNLTNSPEKDEQPKFSPDGRQIAWIRGEGDDTHIYLMNLDGSNARQVTERGKINDLEWSVDGRLFTHWENPDGICFNCVVTTDGKEVSDAGGKGTIQQFRPFWTVEGDRVELVSGDIKGSGHDDIFLVSEKYPDLFRYLTDNSGNNRSPSTAAMCGPTHGVYPQYGSEEAAAPTAEEPVQPEKQFVIGYEGEFTGQMQQDLDLACSELDVQCVPGESIAALAAQKVDAIISGSNRWHVMGSAPELHDAVEQGIPVFVLNAESNEKGAYNLSAENEIYTTTLNWMFKEMGEQGEFVYYNFGNSDYIQTIVDTILKDHPGITAIKKDADYNGNFFTKEDIVAMIAKNINLKAIWSTEQLSNLFWDINDPQNGHLPLTECPARKDELISWKNELDAGSTFKGIASIRPGGTAYEGVYVAYFYLNGSQFNPERLTGEAGNTLKYDIPVITNDTLPEWIGSKLDALRVGENQFLQLPPMTPEQIKQQWFVE